MTSQAKGVFLCSQQHLIEFEQYAVYLVDIGYTALKAVLDDNVKSAALRKRHPCAPEKIRRLIKVEAERKGESYRSLLGRLVLFIAPDLGEQFPVYIGFLLHFRIGHPARIYEMQELLLE